jgi:uncharacterized NAD(P)/FAD-binding protein YdhS
MSRVSVTLIAIALVLPTLPARAHHGYGEYDESREVSFSGTFVELAAIQPHSFFSVSVTGADGKPTTWTVDLPNQALETFPLRSGDRVAVIGSGATDPKATKALLRKITRLSDGWSWERPSRSR